METKVCYLVDRNAAILAGEKFYGEVVVNVDPSALSEAQRKELTLCEERNGCAHLNSVIDGKSLGGENDYWPVISKPSDEAIVQLLNARIEIREKRQREFDEAQKAEMQLRKEAILFDSLVSANPDLYFGFTQNGNRELTEAARQAVLKYPNEHIPNLLKLREEINTYNFDFAQNKKKVEELRRKEAWSSLLSALCLEKAVERLNAGCLSVDVRDSAASDFLFEFFWADFPEYKPLCADDLTHDDQYCEGVIKFKGETRSSYDSEACIFIPGKFGYSTELTNEQFAQVKKIAAAIPESRQVPYLGITLDKVDFDVRVHTVFCSDCDGETQRFGLRATLYWNGSEFSKEYSLDVPQEHILSPDDIESIVDTDTDTDTEEDPYNPF